MSLSQVHLCMRTGCIGQYGSPRFFSPIRSHVNRTLHTQICCSPRSRVGSSESLTSALQRPRPARPSVRLATCACGAEAPPRHASTYISQHCLPLVQRPQSPVLSLSLSLSPYLSLSLSQLSLVSSSSIMRGRAAAAARGPRRARRARAAVPTRRRPRCRAQTCLACASPQSRRSPSPGRGHCTSG